MSWPTFADGTLDQRDQTFREMEGRYPQIGPLRELRYSLSKLRLNDLQVGTDGRNRTLLGPFRSKTGRNQPSNSRYTFGPAKWIRFLIMPPPGRVLIHRDYCQQEVQIAAVRVGDNELLGACQSGDVYLGIAKLLGLAPADATPQTHSAVRAIFKTVVLGIQYGLGARSLALRTGVSLFEAGEILARLRARFRSIRSVRTVGRRSRRPCARTQHAVRLGDAVPARHQSTHRAQLPDPVDRRRDPACRLHSRRAPRHRRSLRRYTTL